MSPNSFFKICLGIAVRTEPVELSDATDSMSLVSTDTTAGNKGLRSEALPPVLGVTRLLRVFCAIDTVLLCC